MEAEREWARLSVFAETVGPMLMFHSFRSSNACRSGCRRCDGHWFRLAARATHSRFYGFHLHCKGNFHHHLSYRFRRYWRILQEKMEFVSFQLRSEESIDFVDKRLVYGIDWVGLWMKFERRRNNIVWLRWMAGERYENFKQICWFLQFFQ